MMSDKRIHVVFERTIATYTDSGETCAFIQTCSCRSEGTVRKHRASGHHELACVEADIVPGGLPPPGQVLLFPRATPSFPHHIFMTLLPPRKLLLQSCQNNLTLASVNSPRATLCVSAIAVFLSVEDKSCFPTSHFRLGAKSSGAPLNPTGFIMPMQTTARLHVSDGVLIC